MSAADDYVADFAVMRTPLLPVEALDSLTRDGLRALLERPEIAEAIFLASPDLVDSVEQWRREPDSKKGRRTEQGLVRYFLRMVTRPTPFGLFSGCTPGRIGAQTRLALAPREAYRRHSRLDMDYLHLLCEHLVRDPDVRDQLTFRPNSSLYEVGGRLRFAESRAAGRLRTYHLVAFDAFDALRETLQRAEGGARLRDLALALVDDEITLDDAVAFVHDLVDNQLLVADLAVPVTGEESLLPQLDALPAAGAVRARLAETERALDESAPRYRELAQRLEPLGVPVELSRLFQVDLIKPAADVVVSDAVVAELLRGVDILHRFSQHRGGRALEDFRNAFHERYGADREVPLLTVLDEENGIGFERAGNAAAEASPLLAGLPLHRRGEQLRLAWMESDAMKLRLLARALTSGATEVEVSDAELNELPRVERAAPDAFHVMAALAAPSTDAVERGDYRIFLHFASGPSGACMLGRFCYTDDDIRAGVARHVAAEEALHPDAIFAEVVHLPAGRVGNILARPVLRGYEIPFLGRSGAPRERQIPLDDLLVSVSGDRIRLRSKRLDREVIPRLTTAHNTSNESLGVYRFLSALQGGMGMRWDWGPLDSAPFLPRVVSGRLVLARARWRVTAAELTPLLAAAGDERLRLAQHFRDGHRMPRHVVLRDNDHELLLDFDNLLTIDAVLDLVRNRAEINLTELYPAPGELCAEGPEGRFFHELVVPFVKRLECGGHAAALRDRNQSGSVAAALQIRTFPPGSEWVYAKIYTGTATADRVLLEEIAPLAADAIRSGAARRWFFIRYSDPAWHLRVRFQGDPRALEPALQAAGARLIDAGLAWKIQFDTYEREVERYGGPEAIAWAEEIFFLDSEAVLTLLAECSGDAGAMVRGPLLAAGIDRLMGDFGCDLAAKLRLVELTRDSFAKQFDYDELREPLAARYRRDRRAFERALDEPVPALVRRSELIASAAAQIKARARIEPIVTSLTHMFVNRLSRSAGPEHELVLYDYLVQAYRSRLARAAKLEAAASRAGARRDRRSDAAPAVHPWP